MVGIMGDTATCCKALEIDMEESGTRMVANRQSVKKKDFGVSSRLIRYCSNYASCICCGGCTCVTACRYC